MAEHDQHKRKSLNSLIAEARRSIAALDKRVLDETQKITKANETALYSLQDNMRETYLYACDRLDGSI